mgnify:CR=1 FL=1
MKKKKIIALLCGLLCLMSTGCRLRTATAAEWIQYRRSDAFFVNPLIGYMQNAEESEPYTDTSLVYIDLTWRELEPAHGQFDWDTIAEANHLSRWRSEGKHAVLRFVCDLPGEEAHRDIPDWLYAATGDGTDYEIDYGRGYCPNYANAVFREEHHRALQEIGRYFSENWGTFVAYVELGSLGHWGEWHVKYADGLPYLPDAEIRKEYVEAYVKAFPKARLLSRRSFQEMPEGTGIYNDVTGNVPETERLLRELSEGADFGSAQEEDAIRPLPDIWNSAPVGGEYTSSLSMENMLNHNFRNTLKLIEETHPSFLGPKIPDMRNAPEDAAAADAQNEDPSQNAAERFHTSDAGDDEKLSETALRNARKIQGMLGYRYRVTEISISDAPTDDEAWTILHKQLTDQMDTPQTYKSVRVTLRNDGLAPMYFDWPVKLYLVKNGNRTPYSSYLVSGLRLMKIPEDSEASTEVLIPAAELDAEKVHLYIGIEDPETGKPAVQLAMDVPTLDEMYLLK